MGDEQRPRLSRSDRAALAVALGCLALAGPYAWSRANFEFVLYAGSLLVIGAAVLVLHLRVRLHAAAIWALVAWSVLHMAGGLVQVDAEVGVLYNLWLLPGWLKYDQAVHAFGFGLCTSLCWQALSVRLDRPQASLGIALLCALGGMGLGAVNEVLEFVAVLTIPDTNVGGYENTGWDLVFNAGGAFTVGAVLWWRGRVGAPDQP